MNETDLLERELSRERRARDEAERLLEAKSAELYAANERLRRLYDHAADAIFVCNPTGEIIDANRQACQRLGYSRDDLLSKTIFELESNRDATAAPVRERNLAGLPAQFDRAYVTSDGSEIAVEVRLAQIESSPNLLYLAIARDVTVRNQQRVLLEKSRKRLRRLASELTLTEAKERRALAQVLHDTIGHDLAVVRMHIKKLNKAAENENERAHAQPALELIEGVVRQVRQVTFDLCPVTLWELGLPSAVSVVARGVSEDPLLNCQVKSQGSWRRVPVDLAILLFYATRELIHNSVKHGNASSIDVELQLDEKMISISVVDNGVGFDPDKSQHIDATTFGLFSIQERLAGLDGKLVIESIIDSGSRVTMLLPRIEADSKENTGENPTR